jgi:hypothetical protein
LTFGGVCGHFGLTRVKLAVSFDGSLCVKGAQARVMSATLPGLDLADSLKIICKFCRFDGIFAF